MKRRCHKAWTRGYFLEEAELGLGILTRAVAGRIVRYRGKAEVECCHSGGAWQGEQSGAGWLAGWWDMAGEGEMLG